MNEEVPEYTDRDLLNSFDAEIETAFDLGFGESTLRVMLRGFRRRIALQLGHPFDEHEDTHRLSGFRGYMS